MPDAIPGITRILAVASGKGGVGKTTVTVNLALALAQRGFRVGIFDADVYGPNVPLLLGVHQTRTTNAMVAIARAERSSAPYIPALERFGLKVMSIGLLVAEHETVLPDPTQVARIVDRTMRDVLWGRLDYLLVDLPPGTGEPQQSLAQRIRLDAALVVTTPHDLALLDASRGLGLWRQAKVPLLGVVENMSYLVCPHCGERVELFPTAERPRAVRSDELPLLAQLPLDLEMGQPISAAHPLVAGDPAAANTHRFVPLAAKVAELLPAPNADALNAALIDTLKHYQCIRSDTIEAAFRAVPRHMFLPDLPIEHAYHDEAIPTKYADGVAISSSSQPAIMAIMLEQLQLAPGQRVLEIGAGTGYNAALLAQIVGEAGSITTVDLDADTVAKARTHLVAAGYGQVRVVAGDGGLGYPPGAPYDRIILTVGSWDVPPAWGEQLAPGGRIVLPLSLNGPQFSLALERVGDHLASVSLTPCGFMRMRGAFAGPNQHLPINPERTLNLAWEGEPHNAQAIAHWLNSPAREFATGVTLHNWEYYPLHVWLALHTPLVATLWAADALAGSELAANLFGTYTMLHNESNGLLSADGLALLVPPAVQPTPDPETVSPLVVRSFGPDIAPAQQLIALAQAWQAAGKPGPERLRLRIYPLQVPHNPAPGEVVLRKRWVQIVATWA